VSVSGYLVTASTSSVSESASTSPAPSTVQLQMETSQSTVSCRHKRLSLLRTLESGMIEPKRGTDVCKQNHRHTEFEDMPRGIRCLRIPENDAVNQRVRPDPTASTPPPPLFHPLPRIPTCMEERIKNLGDTIRSSDTIMEWRDLFSREVGSYQNRHMNFGQ
jgi:hypothetical protein